jgi:MurNAc alpha-1-phosphate uridylyltransferase
MIFVAGRGSRMNHITETVPKSLIPILGRPILYYVLELTLTYPFKKIIINTHYLHEQIRLSIEEFKKTHINIPEIIIIYEPILLETGGAIKNAKELLGDNPIFTLNSDVIIKPNENLFKTMILKWDASKMDFLLLLQDFDKAVGYKGNGDFELLNDGRLYRPSMRNHYSYMYAGLQILKPNLISQNPSQIFSLREYYFNNNNVYGAVIADYKWYHATRPEDIIDIEYDLQASY